MSTKRLRKYQTQALDYTDRDFVGGLNRLVVLLFTGAGKTFTMAHAALRHMLRNDGRVLVLTHRAELMKQIVGALEEVIPNATVGRVKGSKYNETGADIVVGSVPTLLDPKRREQIKDVTLILVDECHHGVSKSWMEVLTAFGAFDGVRTIGFTATLVRNDQLGLGDLWQKVSLARSIEWGIANGFLVPTTTVDMPIPNLDLTDVEPDADGEYSTSVVAKALIESDAAHRCARIWLERCVGRRGIVFAPNKAVASLVADAFNEAGIRAALILGETSDEDREEIYAAHRRWEYDVIVNVGVLTEGYDDPGLSAVMILRVVGSEGLYVQMAGRGSRTAEGKTDCIVVRAVGTKAELATHADLRRSAAPHTRTPRPKTPPPAPTRPPKRSEVYRAKVRGRVALVWRGDVLIAERKAKPGQDPARLARLLIDLDIATNGRKKP